MWHYDYSKDPTLRQNVQQKVFQIPLAKTFLLNSNVCFGKKITTSKLKTSKHTNIHVIQEIARKTIQRFSLSVVCLKKYEIKRQYTDKMLLTDFCCILKMPKKKLMLRKPLKNTKNTKIRIKNWSISKYYLKAWIQKWTMRITVNALWNVSKNWWTPKHCPVT